MKRFKYNLNSTFRVSTTIGEMQVVGIHEVVPGTSISGKLSNLFVSNPLIGLQQNRMFQDTYFFYCPYRLVWEDWPSYIMQQKPGIGNTPDTAIPTQVPFFEDSDPQVAAQLYRFFCKGPLSRAAAATYRISQLPFRIYALIWNTYFRDPRLDPINYAWGTVSAQNAVTDLFMPARQSVSDFHKRVLASDLPLDDYNLGTTTDDLRLAMAKEHFDRLRRQYGNKYLDFLRSMGQHADFAVLEEPELLAKASSVITPTMSVGLAGSSGGDALASKSGYYRDQKDIAIRKRHFVEHGMIVAVQVNRYEVSSSTYSHPIYAKIGRTGNDKESVQYWTPEYNEQARSQYDRAIWTMPDFTGNEMDANLLETRPYLDYTSGMALNTASIDTDTDPLIQPEDYGYFWWFQDPTEMQYNDTDAELRSDALNPTNATLKTSDLFVDDAAGTPPGTASFTVIGGLTHSWKLNLISPIAPHPSPLM